jgi:hypothetical protein
MLRLYFDGEFHNFNSKNMWALFNVWIFINFSLMYRLMGFVFNTSKVKNVAEFYTIF